ncbi:ethanolaminephosphotransferase 1 isoform X1 [Bombyx mori]|uniref:Uncharacterized protein n=2 Tax=Bombyx mori TaxID=7091 RepID=A0A8R2AN47_BOMMO|nr:ethanolaminephosphotransferase 1 [Bombyx mori]XP_021207145.2 ethanolaminephosphotransferase 1 [Bombyx mori]XP_037873941.1 ethanolaminephosphotransferase 1 [Bombyx mori]
MEKLFEYKYLSQNHFDGLKKYKYSAIDTSPLSNYVMHPSWNFITRFIPKWIAPNLITFAGFVCMVIVILLLTIFDYDFHGAERLRQGVDEYRIPNWALMACGVLLFLAYNLDGIDGKQARKLGVSGPLGELFDHGLDSYIVFLIPFSIISIFGRDPVYSLPIFRGFLVVISVVLNFYVSHCEKYNTGTLYLPWGYDVSMWTSSMIFIVAGLYTPGLVKFHVYGDVSFALFFEVLIHLVGLLGTAPVAVYNVYLARKNRRAKVETLTEALRPVWSMTLILAALIFWADKSKNDIIESDPRAFIFLFGTLFSNTASRLMIAGMASQRCELVNWMFWPLLTGVVTSLYKPEYELSILYALVVFSVLAHVHYGICVVKQICGYYKIDCFLVPKEKQK